MEISLLLEIKCVDMSSCWSAVPTKGTGDYKLLLAVNRHYVYHITKGNAGMCPTGRHPISDSLGKLHQICHMVLVLTLAQFIVNCFLFTGINEL